MAADTVAILTFETTKPVSYSAGQAFYINLDNEEARPYSIANAPINGKNTILEFHIGKGHGLSRVLIQDMKVGFSVEIAGPCGDLKFKSTCKKTILAIAGGTGLAQMKAICEVALSTDHENPVYLFHGARDEKGLYIHDHFKKLSKTDSRFHYVGATSEDKSSDSSIEHGFISDIAANKFDGLSGYRAYICGPEAMVVHSHTRLLEKGIDEKRLHIENWVETKRT